MVVDENQILMEEIIASAQGRKRMFDSDEPGGQEDGEEGDDSDGEEEAVSNGEVRRKRQVDQEDGSDGEEEAVSNG